MLRLHILSWPWAGDWVHLPVTQQGCGYQGFGRYVCNMHMALQSFFRYKSIPMFLLNVHACQYVYARHVKRQNTMDNEWSPSEYRKITSASGPLQGKWAAWMHAEGRREGGQSNPCFCRETTHVQWLRDHFWEQVQRTPKCGSVSWLALCFNDGMPGVSVGGPSRLFFMVLTPHGG